MVLLQAPEREESFFIHNDCENILGILFARRAIDVDGVEKIFLKKNNVTPEGAKPSIIKFKAIEVDTFLRQTLVPLATDIGDGNIKFQDTENNFRSPDFWNNNLVKSNPGGEIKLRPYPHAHDGDIRIRFWLQIAPVLIKATGQYWHGPSFSLKTVNFIGFISLLGKSETS